ncbi:MAG TPA: protein kinase [Jatrophihabitans sp.]|jgi:serine/threonine protein kinase
MTRHDNLDHNPYLPSRIEPAPSFGLVSTGVTGSARFRVPGYDLAELLGVGGSGEVWRGRHRRSGEAVAIKYLVVPNDPKDGLEQARHEAAMLAALQHPHLIGLREAVQLPGAVALVLDLAERGSLAQLLQSRGVLGPGEVITTVAPVAAAVAHAHAAGIVHGDITPANVVFSQRGDALLTDLGTARITGSLPPGPYRGYLPTTVDDVYALGALAFRCLVGHEPGTSVQQRQALVAMPIEIAEVVLRALSPEPVARGSAADFALALRASGTPIAIDFTAGSGRPPGPARPAPTRRTAVPQRPIATPGWRSRLAGLRRG